MPSIKHTHQYQRHPLRKGYFRCAHPQCTHYYEQRLLVGKESVCNGCGAKFILTYDDLLRANPLGPCCSMAKEAVAERKRKQILTDLGLG
jgi:hypothetical protein